MSARDDGGPAFPLPEVVISTKGIAHAKPGMSLRDWFAGQALAGYFAYEHARHRFDGPDVTEYVYRIADAMLAERLKKDDLP